MRHGLDDLHLHYLVGEQPQRPPGTALRGTGAAQGHQMGFRLPVEFGQSRWIDLLLAVKGRFQTVLYQPLANKLDGMDRYGKGFGNLLILPIRPIRIGFEKDLGMLDLVCRRFSFRGYLTQLLPFRFTETYNVFFTHYLVPD